MIQFHLLKNHRLSLQKRFLLHQLKHPVDLRQGHLLQHLHHFQLVDLLIRHLVNPVMFQRISHLDHLLLRPPHSQQQGPVKFLPSIPVMYHLISQATSQAQYHLSSQVNYQVQYHPLCLVVTLQLTQVTYQAVYRRWNQVENPHHSQV